MLPSLRFARKIERERIPLFASIELTWRCNQRCIHCFYGMDHSFPQDNELSLSEIKELLDALASAGCLYLGLTGGEPLLRKDFWEIAEYAQQKNFALSLQTNGILINHPEIAERIKQLNFFRVIISLLDARPQTHDRITGKAGSFQSVIQAVRLLKEKKVRTLFAIPLMKENFAEWRRMERLARDLGVDFTMSPTIYPTVDHQKFPTELRINDQQLEEFYRQIVGLKRGKPKDTRDKTVLSVLCNAGIIGLSIGPTGECYPCNNIPLSAGNIRKIPFHQIWQESVLLNQMRSFRLNDLKDCRGCQFITSCFRCPALAWLEEKNLLAAPQEACRMARMVKEVTQ